MKKKVALLLALIMVLSSLPMNLFGASLLRQLPYPSGPDNGYDPQMITVRIDVNDLLGTTPTDIPGTVGGIGNEGYRLEIILSPENALDDVRFASLADCAAPAPSSPAALSINPATNINVGVGGAAVEVGNSMDFVIYNRTANIPAGVVGGAVTTPTTGNYWKIDTMLIFDGGLRLENNMHGFIDIDIAVRPTNADSTITIRLINNQGQTIRTLLDDVRIVTPSPVEGVTFTADGGARSFQTGLILPTIKIVERGVGSMDAYPTGNRTIELIAPFDYAWNVGIPGSVGQITTPLDVVSLNGVYGATNGSVVTGGVGNITATARLTADGRHVLNLEFDMIARNGGLPGSRIAELGLQGLMLVPVPGAIGEGDINIDISWGYARENRSKVALTDMLTATQVMTSGAWWASNWRQLNFTIGTRRTIGLELTTGDVPTLVSGIVGPGASPTTLRPGEVSTAPHRGSNSFPVNDYQFGKSSDKDKVDGHATRTAMVELRELVPGAFDTGFINSMVNFTFDEGVQLVHAVYRINSGVEGARIGAGGTGNNHWMDVPEGLIIGNTNIPTGLLNQGNESSINWLGVPYRTHDYMQIYIPTNPVPTATRTLEVYFFLSVEAGYTWKYETNEVNVYVDGNAVTALQEDNRQALIANVTDPITLGLSGPALEIESGRTHNLTEMTQIENVIITEDENNRLRVNDVFWVYVMGTNIQRPATLAYHTNRIATVDEESGMRLDAGQTFRTQLPNGLWVEGISFRVARASTSGNPATITLTDNYLFGEILPGQDYVVVVSGSRVGANELQVAGRPAVTGGTTTTWERNLAYVDTPTVEPRTVTITMLQQLGLLPTPLTAQMQADIAANYGWLANGSDLRVALAAALRDIFDGNVTNYGNLQLNGVSLTGASDIISSVSGSRGPDNIVSATSAVQSGGGGVITVDVTIPPVLSYDNWPFLFVTTQGSPAINAQTQGIFDSAAGPFNGPYAIEVIKWVGFDLSVAPPAGYTPGGVLSRMSFTATTMYDVDGVSIQAVAFPEVWANPRIVSTMINPRVFAHIIGADYNWDESTRSFTFTGVSAQGVPQTVVLTLDSPTIIWNGQSHDIATLAGQPMLAGRLAPYVSSDGRQYVPARVLVQTIFGIPIEFEAGTVTIG